MLLMLLSQNLRRPSSRAFFGFAREMKIIVIAAFITAWELRQRVTISADDMPQCVVGLTKTLAMYRAQIFPMLQTALDKDIAEMPADVMVFFVGEADLATRHPI